MRALGPSAGIILAVMSSVASPVAAQSWPRAPQLTLEASRRAVAGAQAHARAAGLRVVIAVLDQGGHAILL